jgi:outer membrane biosynthesis protein TonB
MSQSLAIKNSRLSLTTVSDRTSPFGLIVAVLLHVGIIAATLFSFTHKLDIADESPPVVPVDLVTIGKKTDLMAMVKVRVKAPPKEELQQAPPTPTPPPVVTPQTKPEDVPDTAPSSPQIAKAEPAPVPKTKPEVAKPAPPKKEKFDINNIAALLDKQTPAAASVKNAKVGAHNVKAFGAQDAETVELADALRSQIQPCWSPPVGAPHAEDLIVDFDLFLNKDGSVAGMPQLTGDSLQTAASNSYTRAAADAARRAIYQCQPFKLPADQYGKWHEINPFHFDPSQWMGQ